MSQRSPQRTAGCTKADAATRLKQAQKFYEVAELVQTEAGVVESATSVSASPAVLGGTPPATQPAAPRSAVGLARKITKRP